MPFGIVLLLINVGLIVHAAKTGRFWPWGYIILFIPGFGALAYVLVELAPEWFGSVQGQKARRHVVNTLDPSKRYRALTEQLEVADTIANRAALAEECLELGKFAEAEYHYEHILALPIGDDPIYALGRARAQLAAATRRKLSRRSMICANAGRITNCGSVLCFTPAHLTKAVAPTTLSTSIKRWRTITRAPKRVCVTAGCSTRPAGRTRRRRSSPRF